MTKSETNPAHLMIFELDAEGKLVEESDPSHPGRKKPKIKRRTNGQDKDCEIVDPEEFHKLFAEGNMEYVGMMYYTHSSPWCCYYLIGGTIVKVCVP